MTRNLTLRKSKEEIEGEIAAKRQFRKIIEELESRIRQRIEKRFHKRLQVSVQLTNEVQGIFRPDPCNRTCYSLIRCENKQLLCDTSDFIMKEITIREVRQNLRSEALIYTCHGNLSNIVIPYLDDKTDLQWYIFLGQFRGIMCNAKDPQCPESCSAAGMRFVHDQELINDIERKYVKPAMLVESDSSNDNKPKDMNEHGGPCNDKLLPAVSEFTMPELVVCNLVATHEAKNFLAKRSWQDSVRNWMNHSGKEPFDPTDEEITEGIRWNLKRIAEVFPQFKDETKAALEKYVLIDAEEHGGATGSAIDDLLKTKRYELICLSRMVNNRELQSRVHKDWIPSYLHDIKVLWGNGNSKVEQKVADTLNVLLDGLARIRDSGLLNKELNERAKKLLNLMKRKDEELKAVLEKYEKSKVGSLDCLKEMIPFRSTTAEENMNKDAKEYLDKVDELFGSEVVGSL